MKVSPEITRILNQVPPDYYQKGVQSNPLQRYWHGEKVKTFEKISKGLVPKKILDVGCASGMMASKIGKIFPKAKIVALDAYPAAISFGKKKYPQISFVLADAHSLPFKKNSFDIVTCYETIEHVSNPLKVLQELKRITKPEGRVILAMDSGNLVFRIIWFIWENSKGRVWKHAHLHPFKHQLLEKLIKRSGFKIITKKFSHFGMEVSFLLKK